MARSGPLPSTETETETDNQPAPNDYDAFAEAYVAETESNLINAYYTRPAIINLAGDVTGRRILDVGCGAGPILAALRERGAMVTGVDPSAEMLKLARRRLGEDADLRQAGLGGDGDPLPVPDETFDDVIACLVLHYLQDWTAPLADLRRVLKPGGRLIVAVNHPFAYKLLYPDADYFAAHEYAEEHSFDGQNAVLTFWHRSLHETTAAFTDAGFRISVISEPPFVPEAYEAFPDAREQFPSGAFICFLFLVLEKA